MAGSLDSARAKNGYGPNAVNNKGTGTDWQHMMTMFALANKSDSDTMLGFALGKLLHDTWMNYKNKQEKPYIPSKMNDGQTVAPLTAGPVQGLMSPYANYGTRASDGYKTPAQRYADNMLNSMYEKSSNGEFGNGMATGGYNVGNGIFLADLYNKNHPQTVPAEKKDTAGKSAWDYMKQISNGDFAKLSAKVDDTVPQVKDVGVTFVVPQNGYKSDRDKNWLGNTTFFNG